MEYNRKNEIKYKRKVRLNVKDLRLRRKRRTVITHERKKIEEEFGGMLIENTYWKITDVRIPNLFFSKEISRLFTTPELGHVFAKVLTKILEARDHGQFGRRTSSTQRIYSMRFSCDS